MGSLDSREMPSFKCPECKQGELPMPEDMKAFYLRQSKKKIGGQHGRDIS